MAINSYETKEEKETKLFGKLFVCGYFYGSSHHIQRTINLFPCEERECKEEYEQLSKSLLDCGPHFSNILIKIIMTFPINNANMFLNVCSILVIMLKILHALSSFKTTK